MFENRNIAHQKQIVFSKIIVMFTTKLVLIGGYDIILVGCLIALKNIDLPGLSYPSSIASEFNF